MSTFTRVDSARGPHPKLHGRLRLTALYSATMVILSLGAAAMLIVAMLTLFRARRFYTEVAARALGRTVLWMWGIRMLVHQVEPFPETQTVYISNHTSTIDLFVLISLGLPNARFFLSGFLRKLIPLGVIGYLTGTFWTYPQTESGKRVRCFQHADRTLKRSGESVYLSPEGERVTTGLIGPFNKGAFHLATSLQAPIVPLYIRIPRAIDPGKGFDAKRGTVHVHVKPAIDTRDWRLEDLERNRDRARALFLTWHQDLDHAAQENNQEELWQSK